MEQADLDDALIDGYWAAREGKGPHDNPHHAYYATELYTKWQDGYNAFVAQSVNNIVDEIDKQFLTLPTFLQKHLLERLAQNVRHSRNSEET